MTSREFCYWLQGLFELIEVDANKRYMTESLSSQQVECIKRHLCMVFKHETDPSMSPSVTVQAELHNMHSGSAGSSTSSFPPGVLARC